MPLLVENGLATADMGSTTRATKVACISVTASSIDTPDPSFRISTPNILAAHIAPYSLGHYVAHTGMQICPCRWVQLGVWSHAREPMVTG